MKSSVDWTLSAISVGFETRPFIDGDYRKSTAAEGFRTENPANQIELAEFPDCGPEEINLAVCAARKAFSIWRRISPARRKAILAAVADEIARARSELALLDCLEMGMPISMALGQVDMAVDYFRFYAELADKQYGEVAPSDFTHVLAMTYHEPRGVIGVISPWNYPLLTAVLAVAPALAAGNTIVAKPSEHAPSSVLKLAEVAARAGLPAGVLNVVPGRGEHAGAALAKHSGVDKIHFTGSTTVGRQLMVYSGLSNGKPVMLEAGGKSPQIVFDDAADLPDLGRTLAQSVFVNSGQLCVARSRLIVHASVKEAVMDAIRDATEKAFRIGDPLDEQVTLGPIASRVQFDRVGGYLELGLEEGAIRRDLDVGGVTPNHGYFLKPTLLDNARNDMRVAQEEIFGPVLVVLPFESETQAIALANDVSYGLAATAWTRDLGRAHRLTRELNAGRVDVRTSAASGASLSELAAEPFGGSGHGVIGGLRGLDPYMRLKGVQIITD